MTDKPLALSVKAMIFDCSDRCLAIRRSPESKNNAGMWDWPGGKCDPAEDLRAALCREVSEETGLEVRPIRVLGATQSELSDRIVVYLFFEAETDRLNVRLSEEHDEYRWQPRFNLSELPWPEQFADFIRAHLVDRK